MKIKECSFIREKVKSDKLVCSKATINNKSSPTNEDIIVNLALVLLDILQVQNKVSDKAVDDDG